MEYQEADKIIAGLTYKPGFDICIRQHSRHDAELTVSAMLPDADGVKRNLINVVIVERLRLEFIRGREELLLFVWGALELFDKHEREEWLRLDGARLRDPHPKLSHRTARLREEESAATLKRH